MRIECTANFQGTHYHLLYSQHIKPRSNDRNSSTQPMATLVAQYFQALAKQSQHFYATSQKRLWATCCTRLTTMVQRVTAILDPWALIFYYVTDGDNGSGELHAHAFSSPEAALVLVSTKNPDPWPGPTAFRFQWLCKHNRLRPEPIRFVKLAHAQSDGKSVNHGQSFREIILGNNYPM